MPGLGRVPAPDPRDHRMRALLAAVAPPPRPRPWPMFHRPLDQGEEGTCVGHGWKHWMLCAPIIQTSPSRSPTAVELYDRATELDEWDGNEHDRGFGTSVRAGAKALQGFGFVAAYAFAWDVQTVLDWLSARGPVVIGVNWYGSMFEPDPSGYLRILPGARVAGGHCVCLDWYDAKRETVDGPNSWGPTWGPKRGRFKLPTEHFHRLLGEDGEAATAVEVRRMP